MKVFLSHSSADKRLARRLARDLRSAHVDVWLDQWEVRVGEKFARKIEQGLDEVEFVIVLLTSASVTSEWVDREWRHKFQDEAETRRISVVPVRGEPCDVPDFLAQRSGADISGGSYPLGFRHLLTILRHYSDGASIEVPKGTIERQDSPDMLPIVTPIALEVAADLIPLFEPEGASRALNELVPRMRDALHAEFGFPFPGIRIRGNDSDMPPHRALILIDEVPETMFEVGVGEGDAAEHLFLTLHNVLRQMPSLFLDIDVTRRLVDAIEAEAPDLIELTFVLQRLVDEEVGIGDLGIVLDALAHRSPDGSDTATLAEQARHALRGQITAKFVGDQGALSALLVDPEIEALINSAIQRTSSGPYLALAPGLAEDILAAIRAEVASLGSRAAGAPILVEAVDVRPFLRRLVSLEFPALHVLSRQDLVPGTPIQAVARIRLGTGSGPGQGSMP